MAQDAGVEEADVHMHKGNDQGQSEPGGKYRTICPLLVTPNFQGGFVDLRC